MNTIKFLKQPTKFGYRYYKDRLDGFLDDLANFLHYEIGGDDGYSWITFINNHNEKEMYGKSYKKKNQKKLFYLIKMAISISQVIR